MSHSFTNLLYHVVFSTKHREPWLVGEIARARLPTWAAWSANKVASHSRMSSGAF